MLNPEANVSLDGDARMMKKRKMADLGMVLVGGVLRVVLVLVRLLEDLLVLVRELLLLDMSVSGFEEGEKRDERQAL